MLGTDLWGCMCTVSIGPKGLEVSNNCVADFLRRPLQSLQGLPSGIHTLPSCGKELTW